MRTRTLISWTLLCLMVSAGGAFFRLWRLADRPMHTDEAVHAVKYEALLEKGLYSYDPHEYHGPTLNYATLISSFLRGEADFDQTHEATLRGVPAVFGMALVLTPLLFGGSLNKRTVLLSGLLLAFSPAFVYYSRYYIQEMLLVFFTATFLGCGWQYLRTKKCLWLVLSGLSIGLMHATKETFVFSLIAAVAALLVYARHEKAGGVWKISHCLAAAIAMVVTSVLFFSSFGQNWQGVVDSVMTYAIWFQRSGDSIHAHPWYYYLDLLTWTEILEPVSWNEDGIVALALCGLFFVFVPKARIAGVPLLVRCMAAYTLTLTAIYCMIPYKTPWCLLGFLYGMVILAAFALDELIRVAETGLQKTGIGIIVGVFVCASPVYQSWMLNFKYAADPRNPYVYAHTSTDIFEMLDTVENAANAAEGKKTLIYAICGENDHWPFPWYWRSYEKVGYPSSPEAYVCQAPIILANARQEQALLNTLYSVPPAGQRHLYVPLFDRALYLRPGVEWRGYLRKDLYDRMNAQAAPGIPSQPPKEPAVSQPKKNEIEHLLTFSHQAMHTNFQIFIQDPRGTYAARAARAAFNAVDSLEQELSRFLPNSDISRINSLAVGEEAVVDETTMECLLAAQQAYTLTGGAFDITLGRVIEAWKNGQADQAKQLRAKPFDEKLDLDEELLMVKVLSDEVSLDLGGIGKGYAVDVIASVLDEWGITAAMIHGGASSVRALMPPEGKAGWPVTISDPQTGQVIEHLELDREVISSSGTQKGPHIINPLTGRPVTNRRTCWVRLKGQAALSDALSTACMMMPEKEIDEMLKKILDGSVLIVPAEETGRQQWLQLGNWDHGQGQSD